MYYIVCCCQLILGDEIVGFIIQGCGIFVYCVDCDQLVELQLYVLECIVDVVWGESYLVGYLLVVRVEVNDCSGLLCDIIIIFVNEKVNVLGVVSCSDICQQLVIIDMIIEIYNLQVLGWVFGKFNQVLDVIDVCCLYGG